mgnify:CR=1
EVLDGFIEERAGVVPSTAWKRKYIGKNWYLGEVRKIKNPKDFGQYVFTDPAYDFNQNVPLFEEENDGGGDDDGGQTI